MVYEIHVVAVTYYQKLGSHRFEGQKSDIKEGASALPPEALGEDSCLSFSFWRLLAALGIPLLTVTSF